MTTGLSDSEILKEIKRLPMSGKFMIIEETIKDIKKAEIYNEMEKAADLLLEDYINDKELTAFTSIDFDSFYETK